MPPLHRAGLLALALAALPQQAAAQSLDSTIVLNRVGRWAEAAAVAQHELAARGLAVTRRCELRAQLVYSLARLGRTADASSEAAAFAAECDSLPPEHWARREVASVMTAAQRTVPVAKVRRAPDGWAAISPREAGLDSAVLREHRALCERTSADACIVVRRGRIVDEWYGPRYREPIGAMSSTKSVTGLLVGILVAQGKLGIDDPVSRYIPEWRWGADSGVTIRHLLTMTSGLPDERRISDVGHVTDKEAHAFSRRVTATPGSRWAYTNDGVFLLSPIIKRAAGEPVAEFARRTLFEPLGMHDTRMHVYPEGQAWTHADMETTARDFARIGQLMLQGGRWNGMQVVSEEWVRLSITRSQPLAEYGLLWWLDVPGGFAARGYLDTNLYVFPREELVVVRMQAKRVEPQVPYEREARELFRRMVVR